MLTSIPQDDWCVHAGDPMALTKVLGLPYMIVTGMQYSTMDEQTVVYCAHDFNVALCLTCSAVSHQIHDYQRRRVRDFPCAGNTCHIEFAARRFYCEHCQCPFHEELEWLPRCSRLTQRYREFIFEQCRKTTIQAVHQKEHLGYKTVERVYDRMAEEQARAIQPGVMQKLGIDEFAIKKGQDSFALAISDLDAGRIIAVLPDRKKETLEAYLKTWTLA